MSIQIFIHSSWPHSITTSIHKKKVLPLFNQNRIQHFHPFFLAPMQNKNMDKISQMAKIWMQVLLLNWFNFLPLCWACKILMQQLYLINKTKYDPINCIKIFLKTQKWKLPIFPFFGKPVLPFTIGKRNIYKVNDIWRRKSIWFWIWYQSIEKVSTL